MEKYLAPKDNFERLIITNQIDYHIAQVMKLYVRPWEKPEIDRFLVRLTTHNKGLKWRYEKIPPQSGE